VLVAHNAHLRREEHGMGCAICSILPRQVVQVFD
jgi:hypothetical protein